MQIAQPRNTLVLAALSASAEGKAGIARHDSMPAAQAYMGCGCHPDVVERLWDQLGAALPQECRYLVYGKPALVHPGGLILALGMGTSYGLRILPALSKAAADAGAKTITTWTGGGGMDICQAYGTDWIFGSWSALEIEWCKAVYAAVDHAPADLAAPATAAPPVKHDYAAIVAAEQQAHQAQLEQRAAAGDLEATFQLFQVLMNAAFKQHSQPLLDRAGSLLSTAAAGGHPQAMAMLVAWPRLKAEAERKIPKAG